MDEFLSWIYKFGELRDWLRTQEAVRTLRQSTGFFWHSAIEVQDETQIGLSQGSGDIGLSQGSAQSVTASEADILAGYDFENDFSAAEALEISEKLKKKRAETEADVLRKTKEELRTN